MTIQPLSLSLSVIIPIRSTIELEGIRATLFNLQEMQSAIEVVIVTPLEDLPLEADFPCIQITHSDRTQSDLMMLITGLRAASGQVITWLLPGECLLVEAYQQAIQVLETNATTEGIIGSRCLVDDHGNPIGINLPGIELNRNAVLDVWEHPSVMYALPLLRKSGWENLLGLATTTNLWSWNYHILCALGQQKVQYSQLPLVTLTGLQPGFFTTRLGNEAIPQLTQISRAFWNSDFLRHWISWQRYQIDRIGKGREKLRGYRVHAARKEPGRALLHLLVCCIIAFEVAFLGLFFPIIRAFAVRCYHKFKAFHAGDPRVQALMQVHTIWQDNWAGPYVVFTPPVTYPVREIILSGQTYPAASRRSMRISLFVNGTKVAAQRVPCGQHFLISAQLDLPITKGPLQLEIKTDRWHVPGLTGGGADFRPLSFQLFDLKFNGE